MLATSAVSFADEGILADSGDIEEFDLEALLEAPIVESASKRKQSLDDAPASLSVLNESEIGRTSSTYLVEALRTIPGVHVLQVAPNSFFVGARGINGLTNMRTALFVDGRRSGDVGNGDPKWTSIPVHPGDVERVEVIRGPGSTLYGADAYSGVISLTTKQPLDHPGLEAEAAGGVYAVRDDPNNLDPASTEDLLMDSGGHGYVAYGWVSDDGDVGLRGSLGFNSTPEQHAVPPTSAAERGAFGYHARLAAQANFEGESTFLATASHTMSEGINGTTAQNFNRASARSEQALSLRYDDESFFDEALALHLAADAWYQRNAASTVRDGVFRTTEPTQTGWDGSAQLDVILWDERNVLSVGGQVTDTRTTEFFDFEPRSLRLGAFVQNETALLEDRSLVVNLATRVEQITSSNGGDLEATYGDIAPRGSVIWKFSEDQSVRVGAAAAYRNPVPFESYVDVQFQGNPDPAPLNTSIRGNPTLEAEQVRSVELGYRATLFEKARFDVVAFGQQVMNLIDILPENRSPLQWENAHDLTQVGAEIDVNAALASWLSGYVHYTYVRSQNDDSSRASSFFPEHILGLGLDVFMPQQVELNARITTTSGYTPRFFARAPVGGFTIQEFEQPVVTHVDVRLAKRLYNGDLEVFLAGKNLMGFFADEENLREFPSDFHSPIGASVLVGLSLSPTFDSE